MSSEAQKRASSKYRVKNRDKERYQQALRKAKAFILADPNTKSGQQILENDPSAYYDDLRDAKLMLEERISELKKCSPYIRG